MVKFQRLRHVANSLLIIYTHDSTNCSGGAEEELQTLIAAASGYHKVLAENRQLYNEVQDLKGNLKLETSVIIGFNEQVMCFGLVMDTKVQVYPLYPAK